MEYLRGEKFDLSETFSGKPKEHDSNASGISFARLSHGQEFPGSSCKCLSHSPTISSVNIPS